MTDDSDAGAGTVAVECGVGVVAQRGCVWERVSASEENRRRGWE